MNNPKPGEYWLWDREYKMIVQILGKNLNYHLDNSHKVLIIYDESNGKYKNNETALFFSHPEWKLLSKQEVNKWLAKLL